MLLLVRLVHSMTLHGNLLDIDERSLLAAVLSLKTVTATGFAFFAEKALLIRSLVVVHAGVVLESFASTHEAHVSRVADILLDTLSLAVLASLTEEALDAVGLVVGHGRIV